MIHERFSVYVVTTDLTLKNGLLIFSFITGRQWDEEDTNLFLSLIEKSGIDFKNKVKRRKQIWMEISESLNADGYPWSSDDCRKKWSNVMRTFKVAHDAKNDPTNPKRSRWIFYDKVAAILMSQFGMYFPEASSLVVAMNNYSSNVQTEFAAGDVDVTSVVLPNEDIPQEVNSEQLSTSTILLHQATTGHDVSHQLHSFMTSEVMMGEYGPDIEVLTTSHQSNELNATSGDRIIEIHSVNVNSFHPQDDLLSCRVISQGQLPSGSSIIQIEAPPLHPPDVQVLPKLCPDPTISIHRQVKSPADKHDSIPTRQRQRQKRELKTAVAEVKDDALTSRLISVTMEHNEKVLTQMKQFHEDVLGVMRERNKTLSDLCEFFKRS